MSKKKYQAAVTACRHALENLTAGLAAHAETSPGAPLRDILQDACIKRFEILFEYAWKLLKIAAEYQGSEAPGPRPAIQEAVKFGWIDDPELWADALDARNGSVHDYFGISDEAYLRLIRRFAKQLPSALQKIKERIWRQL